MCVCAYTQSHGYVYEAMGEYRAVHANAPVCIKMHGSVGGVQAAMDVTCADSTFLHLPRDQVAHEFHPLTSDKEA